MGAHEGNVTEVRKWRRELIGVSAAAALLISLTVLFTHVHTGFRLYSLCYLAVVVIATALGGRYSAIIAIVATTLAMDYYLIPPLHSIDLLDFNDLTFLNDSAFLAVGSFAARLTRAWRRATTRGRGNPSNVVYTNWDKARAREGAVYPPLEPTHPAYHELCFLCDKKLGDGKLVQILIWGPTTQQDRHAHWHGDVYGALASIVHTACAQGEPRKSRRLHNGAVAGTR